LKCEIGCRFMGYDLPLQRFLRVSEKATRNNFFGERLRWFLPLQAISLQVLEAGTVTLSLARLPERELNAHSDTLNTLKYVPRFRNSTEVQVICLRIGLGIAGVLLVLFRRVWFL